MEFYFRKGGRTLGPLSTFQVRDLLESGEVAPDDLGWHEGMTAWLPVREIEALQFLNDPAWKTSPDKAPGVADKSAEPEMIERAELPPPLRTEAFLQRVREVQRLHSQGWLRFLARSLDLLWFALVVLGGASLARWIDPGEIVLPKFATLMAVPLLWILVEAAFIHRWGATPGKALLGLKVVNDDGSRLTFRTALNRAFDVWFFGCGMETPMLGWFVKLLAMARLRQTGRTSWDAALGLKVEQRPLSSLGITLALVLFVTVFFSKLYIFFHTPLPSHLDPEERKMWENLHPDSSQTKPAK